MVVFIVTKPVVNLVAVRFAKNLDINVANNNKMANKKKQIEYWEVLQRARMIQHTFTRNSLTQAVQYVLTNWK